MKKMFKTQSWLGILHILMLGSHLQGPSMLHKSFDYVDSPASKAAARVGARQVQRFDLSRIANDYWIYLTKGEGKSIDLINPSTKQHGLKDLGLVQQDIAQIEKFIREFFMSNLVQEFAHPVLPAWLAAEYDSITDSVLEKAKEEKYSFLGPVSIRKSVAEYIIQRSYQAGEGKKKYLHAKKGFNALGAIQQEQSNVDSILTHAQGFVEYIGDIESDGISQDTKFIIFRAADMRNQPFLTTLQNILNPQTGNPQLEVIVAFNDQDRAIPDNFTVPNFIRNLSVVGRNLTTVGDRFLFGCSSLTSLQLPSGLKAVSDFFLYNCSGLTILQLPSGLTKVGSSFLSGCRGLTILELPSGLTKIGSDFLYNCSGLTILELPSGLTVVGDIFLYNCSGLTILQLPSGLTKVGSSFLSRCSSLTILQLPSGLTKVGNRFLSFCSYLTTLQLPSGLTVVGDYFLPACSDLTSLQLPSGLTAVGRNFLVGCTGLTILQLPSGLTKVGHFFLYHCTGLTTLQLPSSLTTVGDGFLSDCSGLTSLRVGRNFPQQVADDLRRSLPRVQIAREDR